MTGVISVSEAKKELPQLIREAGEQLKLFTLANVQRRDAPRVVLLGERTLQTLVEHLSCTPEWEEDGEHGLWSVYVPELDVFGQGKTREEAVNSLIEAAQEYADLYLEDAPFYLKVNREHHYPFVIALALARGDRGKATKVLGL